MPAATSFDPLLTRIYELLVDGNGSARTLSAANRFGRKTWIGQPSDIRGTHAHTKKQVIATVISHTPGKGHQENSTIAQYVATVRLEMSYYLGSQYRAAELDSSKNLAATDSHRVRAVLCYPGNLTQTEAAANTGLASGMLLYQSWTLTDPKPEEKELRAIMVLRGHVDITNPT